MQGDQLRPKDGALPVTAARRSNPSGAIARASKGVPAVASVAQIEGGRRGVIAVDGKT